MYYYKIEDADGECANKKIVMHTNEFTTKEFHQMVLNATIEAIQRQQEENIKEYTKLQADLLTKSPFTDYFQKIPKYFEDVRDWVIAILCQKYGFERIAFTSTFRCSSNTSMFDAKEWDGYNGSDPLVELPAMIQKIGLKEKLLNLLPTQS